MRLYTKVICLVTFVVMGVGLFTSVLVSQVMRGAMEEELEEKAVIIAQTLAESVTRDVVNGNRIPVRETVHEIVRRTQDVDYAFIVSFDREIFAHSFEGGFPRALMHEAQDMPCMDAPRRDRYQHLTSERAFIDVSYPLVDGMVAHVHVGMNESRLERQVAALRKRIFGLTFGTVVLAIGLALLISRQVTRPISELADSIRTFGEGKSGEEIHFRGGGSEVADLTRSFNRMITQREQAEEALRKSDRKFRAIFNQTFQFIGLMTLDGTLIEANRSSLDFYGIEQLEVLNRPFWEAPWWTHSSELQNRLRDAIARAAAGEFVRFETWHPAPDGSIHYVDSSIKPVKDEAGNVYLLIPEGRDITEHKRAEEEVRALFSRHQAILAAVPDIIVEVDADKVYTWANQAGFEFFGEDVLGKEAAFFFEGEQDTYDTVEAVLGGDEDMVYVESWQRCKDGESRLLAWWCRVLKDSHGNVSGALSTARDITDRKRAEEALQDSEERYRNIFESVSTSIVMVDKAGNIVDINPHHVTNISKGRATREDYLGQSILTHSSIVNAGLSGLYKRVLEGDVIDEEDVYFPTLTGGMSGYFNVRGVPLLREGKVTGAVFVHENITERKQAEQERENLIAELEAKNAELERFVYTVSHDLRSPLVTITGFLGMLRRDVEAGNAEAMEEDMTFISNAAHKMKQLLDELLDLSRIGRQDNPPVEIALADLAQEVVSMTSEKLAGRGIQVDISPDLPVVFGDHLRLWEVLQNLVDNAEKFMGDQPDPRIEIGSRRDADETVCYVRDNGMGIDPAYHEKVFGLFDRLDPNSEGVGVGLAIVKRIVEVHGGRIWVESGGPGQGATFCFTIPRKREETNHERD